MKKRGAALILAAAMAASSLAACGGSSGSSGAPAESKAAETTATSAAEAKKEEASQDTVAQASTSDIEWPKGTIDIIIPGAAGSNTDLSVRILIEFLEKQYPKAKFSLINEATGSGTLAMEKTRTAKNDGTTLLFTGSGSNIMYHQGKYQYDVMDPNNFTIVSPAAGGAGQGSILLTQPDKPYNNLEEFVEYCKAHPGEVNVGTSTGTTQEIKIKLLMEYYDLDVKYVAASGNDMITALLAGNLDVALQSENKANGYVENGDLKGLVNNSLNDGSEFAALDGIDTYKDLGLEEIAFRAPMYVVGPGNMDEALVQKINEVICSVEPDTESQERWGKMASSFIARDVAAIREEVVSLDADVAQIYKN
ncbi:MAG: hypothetical protein KH366_11345 [Clostridiaceae bacterium]|nr:hypothetical protein [Clostridiaceae bacterium]